MVRISASGDIIQDDEQQARPQQRTFQNIQGQGQQGQGQQGQGQQGQIRQGNGQPVYHMPDGASAIDTLNQKLLDAGVPRLNLGSWTVEPIVLLGFLLAFLFLGFNGILFAGLFFAIVKFSQSGLPTGGQVHPRQRDSQDSQGPEGSGRPGGNPRRGARWGKARWGTGGNRLGR